MIALVDRDTGDVEINLTYEQSLESGFEGSRRLYETITAAVMERGIPAIMQANLQQLQFLEAMNSLESGPSARIRAADFIFMPMHDSDGEIIGVLGAYQLLSTNTPLEENIRLLADLAGLFAQAMEVRR